MPPSNYLIPDRSTNKLIDENTNQLDPKNIQTTILAEIFQEFEEIHEKRKILESDSFMAKIS